MEVYSTRISDIYNTLRQKVSALGHFWCFIALRYPEITSSAEVLPLHGRAYIPYWERRYNSPPIVPVIVPPSRS